MKLKLVLLSLAMGILSFSSVAFAEGDTVCSGRMLGTTIFENPNIGRINFDAHPVVDDVDGIIGNEDQPYTANLAIIGQGYGVAPENREHAACVDVLDEGADTYLMQGWAWNDNLGFISFGCDTNIDTPALGYRTNPLIDTNENFPHIIIFQTFKG